MSMSPRQPVDPAEDRIEAPADPASPSRRRFVRNVGLGAVALGAAAATGAALTGVASAQTTATPPALDAADVSLLQFLQSLLLAAEQALADAADAPGLTSVVSEELRGFSRNSTTQAAAFGALLAKEQAVTSPNPRFLSEGLGAVGSASGEAGVLAAVLQMLESLCATLQASMGQAEHYKVAEVIASVLPIVGQEVAATGTAADLPINQWLPAFGTTDGALTPAAYPVS